eukprot:m.584942 g.584942  ORF g.584942 m.584942 type:complete len:1002 (-) comp57966_c0_seq4:1275-4280(-)
MLRAVLVVGIMAVRAVHALSPLAPDPTPPNGTFEWRWNTEWSNAANWKGRTLPTAGQTVRFPASFSSFGKQECTTTACIPGGVVTVRNTSPTTKTTSTILGLELVNGRVEFRGNTGFNFMAKQEEDVADDILWDDHGERGNDQTCFNNWQYRSAAGVVDSKNLNPGFAPPCFEDTIVFPDSKTYQFTTSPAAYIKHVKWPANKAFNIDAHQYSGGTLNTNSSLCQAPFSLNKNTSYCPVLCYNSCPELIADTKTRANAIIDYLDQYIPFIEAAVAATESAFAPALESAGIVGDANFILPADTSAAAMAIVAKRASSELANYSPFRVKFTCVAPTSGTLLYCTVVANVSTSQVPFLSNDDTPGYRLIPGVVELLFGTILNVWASQETAHVGRNNALVALRSAWFPVSLDVSQRFIDEMGEHIFSDATHATLATTIGVPTANVLNIQVLASTKPSMKTLSFVVVAANGIAQPATAVQRVISVSSTLRFPLPDTTFVAFYTAGQDSQVPASTTSVAVRINVVNLALFDALLLSDNDAADLLSDIKGAIVAKNGLINPAEILQMTLEPITATSGLARRAAVTPGTVAIILWVNPISGLLSMNLSSVLDTLTFESVAFVTVSASNFTLIQYHNGTLVSNVNVLTAVVAQQDLLNNSTLTQFLVAGVSPSVSATGTYEWTNLLIGDQGTSTSTFTNLQCKTVEDYLNQSDIQTRLTEELTRELPITAGAVVYLAAVDCHPTISLQTLDAQPAQFTVKLNITSLYTLFPIGASYVRFPSSVNASLMHPAGEALLDEDLVHAVLQRALGRMFLQALQEAEVAERTSQQNLLTTPAPSTASASAIPLVAGAVAGGFVLLIAIIAVILAKRSKRNNNSADKDFNRKVVAFENPIYKDEGKPPINASKGLYDEPAFNSTVGKKENPMFSSREVVGDDDDDPNNQRGPDPNVLTHVFNDGYLQQDDALDRRRLGSDAEIVFGTEEEVVSPRRTSRPSRMEMFDTGYLDVDDQL